MMEIQQANVVNNLLIVKKQKWYFSQDPQFSATNTQFVGLYSN